MNLLENKRAIVTGGGSGIGFAIAKKMIEEGSDVLITGREEMKLKNACAQLGNKVAYLVWDVRDVSECEKYIKTASDILGGRIDILVNNAGVLTQNDFDWKFMDITPDEWDAVMDTNCKAVFFLCQNMARHMMQNGETEHLVKGHIVNIVSEMGLRPACVPYGISKWGVMGMTKGLGMMLAPQGIVVNGVSPGAITTEMMRWHEGDSIYRESHANKRFGYPEEIASLVVFLASRYGDNIVGEVVLSDGGSSLH